MRSTGAIERDVRLSPPSGEGHSHSCCIRKSAFLETGYIIKQTVGFPRKTGGLLIWIQGLP